MKIIQKVHNLVCDESIINKFCIAYEDNDIEKQIQILEQYRRNLLEQIHKKEKG